MSCVIEGCKSHTGRIKNKSEGITFHRFPKDEAICKEWILRTSKRHWTIKSHSRICSKHFTADSFVPNINIKWRRLKHNALPTLYLLNYKSMTSEEIQMDVCETVQIKSELDAEDCEDPLMLLNTTTLKSDTTVTSDNSEAISSGGYRCTENKCCFLKVAEYEKINGKLQREVTRLKKVSKQRLQKINALKKQLSRLTKKNSNLFSILMDRLNEEGIEKE